jgi:PhoH-like ATPase
MLVSRPIFPLGRDIGFLAGRRRREAEPLDEAHLRQPRAPAVQPPGSRFGATNEPEYQYLLDQKIVEVEALTYIRGRSIPKQFLIVDEAQNLTPHEVKTVLTRAGDGTKVVLTGDPFQIDNPYVDEMSNGLTYTVERFKDARSRGT